MQADFTYVRWGRQGPFTLWMPAVLRSQERRRGAKRTRLDESIGTAVEKSASPAVASAGANALELPRVSSNGLLTPKERELLQLLAHKLSNKETAKTFDIGVETVKWHMKNLFEKLDAASRKHVVIRANVPGILGTEDQEITTERGINALVFPAVPHATRKNRAGQSTPDAVTKGMRCWLTGKIPS